MPHIRVRGMKIEEVKELSRVVDSLANIVECPRDWFTFEHLETTFIFDGEENKGFPFIEVLWFDRGQEAKAKVVTTLYESVRKVYKQGEITVVFTNLQGNDYFENGEHF